MTDDQWRRRRDDTDDFGPPLFGDDDSTTGSRSGGLSFGDGDTGSLPHWTEPPTGELIRMAEAVEGSIPADPTDDLDVWSTFSSPAPRVDPTGPTRAVPLVDDDDPDDITGLHAIFGADEPETTGGTQRVSAIDDLDDEPLPARRTPSRITIDTDPTDGAGSRPTGQTRRPRQGDPSRGTPRPGSGRPAPSRGAQRPAGGTGGRDMPTAVAVGVGLAAVFIGALKYKPWAVEAIIVLVLMLAAVEYFDRIREKGYSPAGIPGIAACVAAPLAVYHYGLDALPLVMFLAFTASALSFIFATGLESNPMPNMAATSLGILWIGGLGSFGAAILQGSLTPGGSTIGTDTLCLVAIAVVANDVGALFVGSSVGRTPLRAWISPNKSIEGFIGGTILTLGAMFLVGIADRSTTWNSTGDLLLLGLAVSIAAPIGDLTESMFKRNLDVKDFGSIVKGHGGVLDRFDGFLFALPAAYYLLVALEPWVTK